jgi:hypothetical protein
LWHELLRHGYRSYWVDSERQRFIKYSGLLSIPVGCLLGNRQRVLHGIHRRELTRVSPLRPKGFLRVLALPAVAGGMAGLAGSLILGVLVLAWRSASGHALSQPTRPATTRTRGTALEREQWFAARVSQHNSRIADHSREPIDRAWAQPMEKRVFDVLAEQTKGLKVLAVDCRTSTCVVAIEWPSYEDALAGFSPARVSYGDSCTRSVVTPPPAESRAPNVAYRASMIVSCLREAGAEVRRD